jgi:ATP diphosphatase
MDRSALGACRLNTPPNLAPNRRLRHPRNGTGECFMDNADHAPPQGGINELLAIMERLRAPQGGCPWDQVQDFASIAPYTIEEAYEVADAAQRHDMPALRDELGDLLFQVVYHAQMASEAGAFTFADVTEAISAKMVRRHPHVFGDQPAREAATHTEQWEAQKAAERRAAAQEGTLAGVPLALPALTRAEKLTKRAARVGFDWPNAEAVLAKLTEETEELRAELPLADADRLEDELGDMLFVLANLARKLKLDPEAALRRANAKFTTRFTAVEHRLAAVGTTPTEAGLQRMEAEWQQVKKAVLF